MMYGMRDGNGNLVTVWETDCPLRGGGGNIVVVRLQAHPHIGYVGTNDQGGIHCSGWFGPGQAWATAEEAVDFLRDDQGPWQEGQHLSTLAAQAAARAEAAPLLEEWEKSLGLSAAEAKLDAAQRAFAANLAMYMTSRGTSDESLGASVGLPSGTIVGFRQGRYFPQQATVRLLAEALGVAPDRLWRE